MRLRIAYRMDIFRSQNQILHQKLDLLKTFVILSIKKNNICVELAVRLKITHTIS